MIQLHHISYSYRSNADPAVRDVSFSIPDGASLALLGPNGAGKTTLLDIILGWRTPDDGSVRVNRIRPDRISRKEAGRIMSLSAQSEHISFSFSVLDYVLFGRAPHLSRLSAPETRDFEIARGALADAGIAHLEQRSVTDLSGGETQLVKIARSLAQQTAVLLMDEPTSDLDPGNTARVLDIMKQSHAAGRTLIFTTHDPMLASEAATHAALIKAGSLIFFGKISDALQEAYLSSLYETVMHVVMLQGRRIVFRSESQVYKNST